MSPSELKTMSFRVKKLKWTRSRTSGCYRVFLVFVDQYQAAVDEGNSNLHWLTGPSTMRQAMAACQKHYENETLSRLEKV